MVKQKRARYLYDLTKGRQGVFVEKTTQTEDGQPLQADVSGLDGEICQVLYYPTMDGFKNIPNLLKAFIGQRDPVRTSQKFPTEAVYHTTLDSAIPGQPREVVVIEEDQYGDSMMMDKIGEKHDRKIANLQKKRQEARREKGYSEVEAAAQDEEDDDEYERRDRRRGEDPLGGYERGRGRR